MMLLLEVTSSGRNCAVRFCVANFFTAALPSLKLSPRQNNLGTAIGKLTGNLKTNAAISTSHNNNGCGHLLFSTNVHECFAPQACRPCWQHWSSGLVLKMNNAAASCMGDSISTPDCIELIDQRTNVKFGRVDRYAKTASYRLVRHARCQKSQHFQFAWG
jgi:hypothetical protein